MIEGQKCQLLETAPPASFIAARKQKFLVICKGIFYINHTIYKSTFESIEIQTVLTYDDVSTFHYIWDLFMVSKKSWKTFLALY